MMHGTLSATHRSTESGETPEPYNDVSLDY